MEFLNLLAGLLACAFAAAMYVGLHVLVSLNVAAWLSWGHFKLLRLARMVPRRRATVYALLVWGTLIIALYSVYHPGSIYGTAVTLVLYMAGLVAISVAFLGKLRHARALFSRWEWKLAVIAVPAASVTVAKSFAIGMLGSMFSISAANLPSTLTFATFFMAAKLASVPFMLAALLMEILLLLILLVEDLAKRDRWRTLFQITFLGGMFFAAWASSAAMNNLAGTHFSNLLVGQIVMDFDAVEPKFCQLSDAEKDRWAKKQVQMGVVYLSSTQEIGYLLEAPINGTPKLALRKITAEHVKKYMPQIVRVVACNKPLLGAP